MTTEIDHINWREIQRHKKMLQKDLGGLRSREDMENLLSIIELADEVQEWAVSVCGLDRKRVFGS